MDDLDYRLIAELRINGRASIPKLAAILGVARGTVQNRLQRLMSDGTIAGFTVKVKDAAAGDMIRGIMLIALSGRTIKAAISGLKKTPGLASVHTTNGVWDLVAEIEVTSMAEFNRVVTAIRVRDGVEKAETYLFLGPA
jgi:DNA-binding Lrp family transcriptional regulator